MFYEALTHVQGQDVSSEAVWAVESAGVAGVTPVCGQQGALVGNSLVMELLLRSWRPDFGDPMGESGRFLRQVTVL